MADPGEGGGLGPDDGGVGSLEEEFSAIGYENAGDALPPFASDAAKQLDKDVKIGEKELQNLEYHIDENAERVKVMAEHLQNVQQEVTLTQQLVDARRREYETEEHLKQLCTRQVGRIESETKRLHRVIEEYKDRTNTIQTDIFKGNEKLDQFKLEMNWNQEELEQWALAARQKEEDEIALERYRRSDEVKIQELTLEIEKLTLENNTKKAKVEEEVTNTQAQQIEMDKTAEQFQQLHEDRKKLIAQWEESVQTMKARDLQLNKLGEVYAQHLQIRRQKEQRLKEKQNFLTDTQNENKKVETVIMASDRQLMRIRLDHMNVKGGLTEFQDEVDVLKNQLGSSATKQAAQRNRLVQLKEQVEEKKVRLAQLNRKLGVTQDNLEDEKDVAKIKEMSVAKADEILKDEMLLLGKAEKDLKLVKEDMFKQTEELQRLRLEERNAQGEISSAQSAIKNLSGQIAKLDAERQRQQELLYAVDFQSQLMQRKVARVSGEGPVANNEEIHAKIAQLEEQLEEQKQLELLLQAQVKRQVNDVRSAEKIVVQLAAEQKRQEELMNELELENESIARAVASTTARKEEILVHRDLVKLESMRIRSTLNNKTEKLFTLQNRKEQLAISMIEREKEIEVHQDILKSKLKTAEDDRHKNAIELAERKSRIYNLKMKYESIKNKMKQEGDGQHSQAYYVLKAAQAREELQRKGDELDSDIKKAEKEVRALENTLSHLTTRNERYKSGFRNANTLSHAEADQKQVLEEQNQAANDILYKKKKQLQQIEKEHQVDAKRLEEVQRQGEFLDQEIRSLMATKDSLDKQLSDLHEVLKREKDVCDEAVRTTGEQRAQSLEKLARLKALQVSNEALHDTFRAAIADLASGGGGGRHQDLLPLYETFCREYGLAA